MKRDNQLGDNNGGYLSDDRIQTILANTETSVRTL